MSERRTHTNRFRGRARRVGVGDTGRRNEDMRQVRSREKRKGIRKVDRDRGRDLDLGRELELELERVCDVTDR